MESVLVSDGGGMSYPTFYKSYITNCSSLSEIIYSRITCLVIVLIMTFLSSVFSPFPLLTHRKINNLL
jgi:hypothetical protein